MNAKTIPFIDNPDNEHCFQCAIGMILKRDFPDRAQSFEEIVQFTGKKAGMWTWPTRGLVEMKKLGYEVVDWSDFDYQEFIGRGGSYLLDRYGEEVGQAQIEHCDLAYEIENARELHTLLETRRRIPTWEDLVSLIEGGYLMICNINPNVLNGQPGYAGHFVLVYEILNNQIKMHDPGPPAFESRVVSRTNFLSAWEYPTDKERNLMGFKLVKKEAI